MYRLTKLQRKNQERVQAWLTQQPFRESSRDKTPAIPNLTPAQVRAMWAPESDPGTTGQFFTPEEMAAYVAAYISRSADLDSILEPCAGLGSLVAALPESAQTSVMAIELSRTESVIGQRLLPNIRWLPQTNAFSQLPAIEGQFSTVLCNPPFNVKWGTYEAEAVCVSGATLSEHRFLELAIRALRPGGQAFFIAPYNFLDRVPKTMRAWLAQFNLTTHTSAQPLPGEFALTKIRVHLHHIYKN